MTTLLVLLLSTAAQSPPAPEAKPEEKAIRAIPWQKSFAEAREASVKSQKPLLIDFGAEWCGFCKKLDRETFADAAVIRLVTESFVAVKVDTDKEPDLAKKYEIQGLPTLIFLSPGGEVLERLEGFRPPENFLKEARKPVEASTAFAKIQELAQKDPKDIAAQRAYARALAATRNFPEAFKVLQAAQAALPKEKPDPALLLDLGDVLRAQGSKAEARAVYGKLVEMTAEAGGDPREKAFVPLATVLLELKDSAGAVTVLDALLKNESKLASKEGVKPDTLRLEALFLRGYIHAQRKDSEKALADLKLARDADPDGPWGQRAALIMETVAGK